MEARSTLLVFQRFCFFELVLAGCLGLNVLAMLHEMQLGFIPRG